jgi:hypothetical protein
VIEALRACTPHFCREQVIQRLDQPPVTPEDDEFIADENLLLHPEYYYKQSLEGVSADNDTVKHCNLAYNNIDKFNCGCGCAAQAVRDVELDARLLRLSLTFVQ